MSTRERTREKKEKTKSRTTEKKSESIDKKTESGENERTPREVAKSVIGRTAEKTTQHSSLESGKTTQVTDSIQPLLPLWGNREESEWMYHIPDRGDDKKMWAQEWADFLLEWTQDKVVHIISVTMFLKESPFNEILGKSDAFKMIGDALVEKEMADWTSRKKRQLRIYWRPLEEWADIIYQWALETGQIRLDVKSLIIQNADQDFASLPEKDLYIVMELMVEKEFAEWVDKKRGAIKVNLI
ncbi:MAG: hypothetical protein GF411_11700 [Candidatus Lokiarchaeota archaeon]|nr:hypothetical protein [Candidatus Lokiarchaeota archaeon]